MQIPSSSPWTPDDRALVDRYLAGECQDADRARAQQILRDHPSLLVAARILADDELLLTSADVSVAWMHTQRRLAEAPVESATRPSGRTFRRGPHVAWLAAPMIAIALIGGVFSWRALAPSVRTFLASHAPASPVPMRYVTAHGQRTVVRLADGSTVVLNAGSRLGLPTDFSSDHRTVELVGEGLFTVAHLGRTPFTVMSGTTQTRVLGTTFDVRHYATDTQTRVVVLTGKVAVQAVRGRQVTGAPHVLTAADLAIVSDSGALTLIPRVDVDDYTAWADGRLVFRGTPLRDVVLELGRAYSVDIVIADSALAERRVTLTAATTARSLTAILDAIAPIVDAHYTRDGRVITLRRGHTADTTRRTTIFPSLETQYGR